MFFDGGWLGEAEISYAGPGAEARARLAMEIMRERLGGALDVRFDLIGVCSILGDDARPAARERPPGERATCACASPRRTTTARAVDRLLREVTALWTGGPAGGGGVRTRQAPAPLAPVLLRAARAGTGALRVPGVSMAARVRSTRSRTRAPATRATAPTSA